MNILRMVCDRDDNNYTVWSTSIPLGPKVPSKYPPSFHGSSSCCIILCILHHEWIVTVVVTFVQIRHPAGRRRNGSRRRWSSRRRNERRRVSTRLNIIFLKPVVLLYEYIMDSL